MRHCLKQCLFESTKDLASCLKCSNKWCRSPFAKCADIPEEQLEKWMGAFDTGPTAAVTPAGVKMLAAAKVAQKESEEKSAKSAVALTKQHIRLAKDKIKELDDDKKMVTIAQAESAEASAKAGMQHDETESVHKLVAQEKALKSSKERDTKAETSRMAKEEKDQDAHNEKATKVTPPSLPAPCNQSNVAFGLASTV